MAEWGDEYVGAGGLIRLRCGPYQDVLGDVEADAVITDPPYGERTHEGQRHGRFDRSGNNGGRVIAVRGLPYDGWSQSEVRAFCERFASCSGWVTVLTSHDLFAAYAEFFGRTRYVFAPVGCVQPAMNVRLAGDGPANWTVWMNASRPRTMNSWGALPGAYVIPPGYRNGQPMPGGKPLPLMRALVRDYSRPGDLVVDPCAGGATTLIAAAMEGRRAIGAELSCETFELACRRIERTAIAPPLFHDAPKPARQESLGFDGVARPWDLIDRDDPQSGW